MSGLRNKFLECLKAMEDEFKQGQVQVQGNMRMLHLGAEDVPGQGIQARLSAGSILGAVEQMMVKNKPETPVQGLEEYQLKMMDLEGRVIMLRKELDKEKNAGIIKDNKLKELQEELQKEIEQKLVEVNVEKESRKAAEDKLSKKETELNNAKDLIIMKDMERIEKGKLYKQTKDELRKERELRIAESKKIKEMEEELKKEKELRVTESKRMKEMEVELKKEKELRTTENKKAKETEEELKKEKRQRITAEESFLKKQREFENEKEVRVKLEKRCAELESALQKGGAQQKQPGQTAQQKKPQLTAEEQKKYGEQLLAACDCGDGKIDVSAVRRLLSLGVDCDVRDWFNRTPLHWAAQSGHADICQLLLDAAPALVDVRGSYNFTPLHVAAYNGHMSVVRLLVLRGADRGLRDYDGQTALDLAVSNNCKQVADYLTQLT